jgi:outer membrane protein assembly factor BamA
LNNSIRQTISAGHENQLGVNSNSIRLNYVRHTVSWNIIRDTLLSTEFFYEDAEESGGFIDEHFHRFGGALTLGYQLTPHVTLGLRYQYTQKDSDVVLRDYEQNRVSLDGTYSF